jgi:O-antigen ligase
MVDSSRQLPETAYSDRTPARRVLVACAALLLAVVYFALEHDLRKAGTQLPDVDGTQLIDDYGEQAEEGDGTPFRRIALVSLAAAGAVGLVGGGRPWRVHPLGTCLLIVAVAWCTASVVWSDSPMQSLRRLVTALCSLIGVIGLARQLTAREFCQVVVLSGIGLILFSLFVDLAAGARPWNPDYRFGGTLHPNLMACYCALVCLAAYCAAAESRWPVLWWAIVLLAAALLLLTKSRTGLAALLTVLVAVVWLRMSATARYRWLAAGATAAAVSIFALGVLPPRTKSAIAATALLGRGEDADSFTGRLPLWNELVLFGKDRILLGHGYEGFWTPRRIAEISESQEWALQECHNAYLELLLNVGIVGTLVVLALVLIAAKLAQDRRKTSQLAGYGFVFGLLLFGLVNGGFESLFVATLYPSVMAACGLCMVVLFDFHRREVVPAEIRSTGSDVVPCRGGRA